MKRQVTDQEKIFVKHISDTGPVYIEHSQLNTKTDNSF